MLNTIFRDELESQINSILDYQKMTLSSKSENDWMLIIKKEEESVEQEYPKKDQSQVAMIQLMLNNKPLI